MPSGFAACVSEYDREYCGVLCVCLLVLITSTQGMIGLTDDLYA